MPWDGGTFVQDPVENHAARPSVVGIAAAGASIGDTPTASEYAPIPPPDGNNWLPQNRGDDPTCGVMWSPSVGGGNLESIQWNNLLVYAKADGGPFVAGVVLAGMSELLSQEQADWLNANLVP